MRALERSVAAADSPPVSDRLLTRPLPGWLNATNFLWSAAALLGLAAILLALLARPVLTVTWEADRLTSTVPDKNDLRIWPAERDPAGQRFAWTAAGQAQVILPASAHSGRPLKVTVRARGASAAGGPANPTRVSANGVPLGEINPRPGAVEFQDFSFNFVPRYTDDHRVRLQFDTPPWKAPGDPRGELGLMLQAVSLDLSEVWSPVTRPDRSWLVPLLAILTVFSVALKLLQVRRLRTSSLLGYGAAALLLAAAAGWLLWLGLLARVGYNGELNKNLYWLLVIAAAYLVAILVWTSLAGWSWGAPGRPTLLQQFDRRTAAWRSEHPHLSAAVAIAAFNLALSLVFVGKLVLESGSIAPTFRYWDGPEYVLIAHNFYDLREPLLAINDFGQHSPFYWAAHFPGFALALMLFQPVTGWLWAPLVVNFLASTLFAFVFYRLLRDFNYARHPLLLALIALVLPVRWIIYHNVGGSEPLFMLCQVLSLYCYKKEKYWLAGLAGAGAVLTRPPGLFLWAGFMLLLLFEAAVKTWNERGFSLAGLLANINWRAWLGLLLMPAGLLAVFGIFAWRYGDFWAYFKITENVTHIGPVPFPTLMTGKFESPALIFTYTLVTLGLVTLWRQRRYDIFWISFAAFVYTLFLTHSDVLRYSIPFFALAVLLPFADYFTGRVARWLAAPALVALLLYSWGVFNTNLAWVETFERMKTILGIKMS